MRHVDNYDTMLLFDDNQSNRIKYFDFYSKHNLLILVKINELFYIHLQKYLKLDNDK